ncbi:MAG TPA: flagellar basal body L-ring protein FlgH [Rhodocyclaceae bacterium]|nr:flagellar basal body L-ring protein FlgH [Rhodocyclaceae bacterium]
MYRLKLLIMLFASLSPVLALADGDRHGASLLNLVGDRKAVNVGDVLLVQVVETSSATASADTTTAKKSDAGAGIAFPNTTKNLAANLNSDFSGAAKIVRSDKVLAQVSVVVTSVDKAGLLTVQGQQVIEINGDKQQIELTGHVRPEDVSDGNTIVSSRIADARIRYVGDGVLAETQHPGLISRILSWLGLI